MTQSTRSQAKLLTFAEYLAYDDGTDTRYELEDGELVEMPTESPENNRIAQRLYIELLKRNTGLLILKSARLLCANGLMVPMRT